MMFNENTLLKELSFKAIRSSGSGGQNVNKVATKIELVFDISKSLALSDSQKTLLFKRLANRITKDHLLILQCGETRSQHRNKALIIKRFLDLIKTNLILQKKRKASKIPKSIKLKRLKAKRLHADKKANRKKLDLD